MQYPINMFTATTAAVTASVNTQVYIADGHSALFVAVGLDSDKEVNFYHVEADYSTGDPILDDADTPAPLVLTATAYQVRLYGPLLLRVDKDVTAGAATVQVLR